ncbi:MAG: DUF6982 domain-containing protein [Myxococcota bacterium]
MATHNKVVIRFRDGRMLKGSTKDFVPNKDLFHLSPADAANGAKPVEVRFEEIKALFFVRDFAGKPRPQKDPIETPPSVPGAGRGIRVMFQDGEILVGNTNGYQPGRLGFFVVPADPDSNNERCFVISSATMQVSLL